MIWETNNWRKEDNHSSEVISSLVKVVPFCIHPQYVKCQDFMAGNIFQKMHLAVIQANKLQFMS